ncbi:tetratricopeptide repeat protein [uncultured Methanocorpusculum sp.]|nr:tetratricopeptide repeat protein [uncultured Methanocorpusculum sp.]
MLQKIRRFFADPPHPADADTDAPQGRTLEPVISRLEREAGEGNVEAMFRLGSIFISGDGAERDPALAKEWFEKVAAEGNTVAMRRLAGMYAAGDGVDKDPAKEKEWLRKAEEIEIMLKAMGLVWGVAE